MIPYGRQSIKPDDVEAVRAVLQSDFLTQGPTVPLFEEKVSIFCNAEYGVATNSATSALHIACIALDVSPGDLVWTTPITFVASANCAIYCGADIEFVDIDPKSYNMSIPDLQRRLEHAEIDGRLPKVVIPVHLAGQSCDMQAIARLSSRYGFKIIEDASHAIGGEYLGERIGNCIYSDITVFSFHPVKIITTGEGGMAVTNNSKLANRMRRLRSHGITRELSEMQHPTEESWYYEQIELGYNYRMTDMAAALGCSQMSQIESFLKARQAIFDRYSSSLVSTSIVTPWQDSRSTSAHHLYIIRLETSRSKIFNHLRNNDIQVNIHYIPIYRQPYFESMGFDPIDFPNSESYYSTAISLPIFPSLTNDQQEYVITHLLEALAKYS